MFAESIKSAHFFSFSRYLERSLNNADGLVISSLCLTNGGQFIVLVALARMFNFLDAAITCV